jgi:hypothetical protein
LRELLLDKYKLKDIGIKNFCSAKNNFYSLPDEIQITENDLDFIVNLKAL